MDKIPEGVQLPAYRSCKLVRAARIVSITPPGAATSWLSLAGVGEVEISAEWMAKHNPREGGYLVGYPDGYLSWSPAAAFENGCTRLSEWGVLRSQEPKYGVNEKGRLFNRVTEVPIPDEEPVFIFRGKDALLPAVLATYAELLRLNNREAEAQAVESQLLGVNGFQASYSERVKVPGQPPQPAPQGNPGQEA